MNTLESTAKSKEELKAESSLDSVVWEELVDFCSDHLRHFQCYPATFEYEDPESGELLFETNEVLDVLSADDMCFVEADAKTHALKAAKLEWATLVDIPINHDGKTLKAFKNFPPGTDVHDIWRWFEAAFFNVSVACDLMGQQ
jgi:hypothetical protein